MTGDRSLPPPPTAESRPLDLTLHGDRRVDEFHWLRDRKDPAVTTYLEQENEYARAAMAHTVELQATLYQEMVARIQETDLSAPYRRKGFFYYSRTEEGGQYRIHCRKQGSLDQDEQILIDENQLAEGKEFLRLGVLQPSPDQSLLAWSVDHDGDECYRLKVRRLSDGVDLEERIPDTYDSVAWANDNQTLFYTTLDAAHRPYRVFRHRLGTDPASDQLVFEEPDERFFVHVGRSRSGRFLFILLESRITSEAHYLDADDPAGSFQVLEPRRQGVEYSVGHHGERFFVVTNEDATNFKLMETPVTATGRDNWREVIPHREDVLLAGIDLFQEHLVVYQRERGLPTIHVRALSADPAGADPADADAEHSIEFPESAYAVAAVHNHEFETSLLRFQYSSMITPDTVFDYDMATRERTLIKQMPVLGGYDPGEYVTERIHARAGDGAQVPISLVRRRDLAPDVAHPTLLLGYGAYGIHYEARFSSARISLLDRGFVVAIANPRGGGELGRRWYESGKFLDKKNSFTDFIACAEHLIESGRTEPSRLAIMGGSAGGLLVGAVSNLRPELFQAVVAQVPFVDIVTTMLDESLPLTVIEYEEWGNPNQAEFYHYMKSYSPYDNVAQAEYPHMLITAGLNDPRVGYFEPAKWCARLRQRKTDDHLLLLKTNMGAGHGGASGRYDSLKEVAFEFAFVIDRLCGEGVDA